MTSITILRTGLANLASVTAAFRRLGADIVVADDADTISGACLLYTSDAADE